MSARTYTLHYASVPFWSQIDEGQICYGTAQRMPYGTPVELIAGTVDRPLVRAQYLGVTWYAWLMPGDLQVRS